MATLSWYWHRLGAMTPGEVTLRARAKLRELADSRRTWSSSQPSLESSAVFPMLRAPEEAPDTVREALQRDVEDILAGRWKAFGHLALQVDDPPKWHRDYLIGKDLATSESGFKLNHRALPGGADVKLIWELSRWYQLVRLAMAAYVLHDERARRKCIEWLEDWVAHNPPYVGWNWTSALEVGMRLIQFTWIDALLGQPSDADERQHTAPGPSLHQRLDTLRQAILPPHVWYAWRHKSCGSSANNHLLGELAGCILAIVRWPRLSEQAVSLEELQACWEREVLAQFASDGGNREQALHYHLFSFELCWQTLLSIEAGGGRVSEAVTERLALAAEFFREVQVASDPWDYGDSDDAFVLPVDGRHTVPEWRKWIEAPSSSPETAYWMGWPPAPSGLKDSANAPKTARIAEWRLYPETGIAVRETSPWRLRWDLSPLGYLSTAAHGHLDALHLSLWFDGVAMVVDPGTGAYFADERLRSRLASRAAHNGPCPDGPEIPRRLAPFLWSGHHALPTLREIEGAAVAMIELPGARLRRRIAPIPGVLGWQVDDDCLTSEGHTAPFRVRWQFPPDTQVKALTERSFAVERHGVTIALEPAESWATAELADGIVSPGFREVCRAPFLELTAGPLRNEPGPFRTTFRTVAHK